MELLNQLDGFDQLGKVSSSSLLFLMDSEKLPQLIPRRTRNRNVALSLKKVRRAAESRCESAGDQTAPARPKIGDFQECGGGASVKSKKEAGGGTKLSERYENLCEFFNSLDNAIRLLRLKGSAQSFTNICPKIECFTDRRFTYSHLAQLKFILPEVIEINRTLVFDERTSCMKPDLHINLNLDALDDCGKKISEGRNIYLRRVFRARIAVFSKTHPAGHEVPEEALPEPFNIRKQDLCSKVSSDESTSLSEPRSEDLNQQLAVAGHLPITFQKRFSQKSQSNEVERPRKSPENESSSSQNNYARRPPRTQSLKFDSPMKNGEDLDGKSSLVDNDILDVLPLNLLQSIREKERLTMEERDPAISQAKRPQMISCLPKLFNMIHFLFQSISSSVITKEELVHKLITSHSDIVDRREVDEQISLLLKLVPDWISEKLTSGGDLLLRINKVSSPASIRTRLDEAKCLVET